MRIACVSVFSTVLLVSPALAEDTAPFTITKQRNADEITVTRENGVTVFNIRSSNGIGWAKIANDKAWPMKALVRLSYASGRQWQHLENFSIASPRAHVSTSLRGNLEVRPMNKAGGEALNGLSKEELAERVGMQFNVADNGLEAELPMTWLAEEREFTLRWIDLYRN